MTIFKSIYILNLIINPITSITFNLGIHIHKILFIKIYYSKVIKNIPSTIDSLLTHY
jgi:hypothetical protein